MKKTLFSTIFGLFALVSVSNAQLFIGGDFSFATTGGNTKTTPSGGSTTKVDNLKTSNFNFNPKAGVFLGEKLAVGAELNLATASIVNTTTDNTDFTYCVGMAPFARFYMMNFGKIKVFTEGQIGIMREADVNKNAGTTTQGDKRISTYFDVTPAIAFDLTDKIELEANINCLNMNLTSKVTKTKNTFDDDVKDTDNSFNFGVDADNLLTTGFLTVGFIFKL